MCMNVCVCVLRQLAEEVGHVLDYSGHGGRLAGRALEVVAMVSSTHTHPYQKHKILNI